MYNSQLLLSDLTTFEHCLFRKLQIQKFSFSGVQASFYEQMMLARHPFTGFEWAHYCSAPLLRIFADIKVPIPDEYVLLLLATVGFQKGANVHLAAEPSSKRPDMQAFRLRFCQSEIQMAQMAVESCLCVLVSEAARCKDDLVREVSVLTIMDRFVGTQDRNAGLGLSFSDEQILVQWYGIQSLSVVRKSRPLRLLGLVEKLLLYWEVLHHSGYCNASNGRNPTDAQWVEFN